LDAPGRVVDLYRAVLIEAATPQDLYAYLDDRVLRRLWALLWLPAQLRRTWEQKFPVLAESSPASAAVQRTDRIFVTKTEPATVAAATVPNRAG
jgi:hypothetical protein